MSVRCTVNGVPAVFEGAPTERLLTLLNRDLGLTGPRQGCGVGRCGTCLVLLDGEPVNACLTLAAKLEGRSVTTIEGMTDAATQAVQTALVQAGAVQCGYCAPGLVTALTFLLAQPSENAAALEELIAGQLCRCTGYGGVRRAIALLTGDGPQ